MITSSPEQLIQALSPTLRGMVTPAQQQVYLHYSLVERVLADFLEKEMPASASFTPTNYCSTLLALYERSACGQSNREKLISGELDASSIEFISAEEIIKSALAGKRIFECGCRDASLLSLCQRFGADVAGLTDSRYIETAKTNLETSTVFEGRATEIPEDAVSQIKAFNPDYFISVNLFDSSRKLFPNSKDLSKIFAVWANCVDRDCQFVLIPSVDNSAEVSFESLEQLYAECYCGYTIRGLTISKVAPKLAYLTAREEMHCKHIAYFFRLQSATKK